MSLPLRRKRQFDYSACYSGPFHSNNRSRFSVCCAYICQRDGTEPWRYRSTGEITGISAVTDQFRGRGNRLTQLETTQALRQATATLHPRDDFLTDVTSFAETDCIQQAGFQRNILLTQLTPECAVSPFDPQHIERVAVDRRCTSGKERSLDGIIPVGWNIQRKTVAADWLAARYQQTYPCNGSCCDTMEWSLAFRTHWTGSRGGAETWRDGAQFSQRLDILDRVEHSLDDRNHHCAPHTVTEMMVFE
jgi:hypothetical protein